MDYDITSEEFDSLPDEFFELGRISDSFLRPSNDDLLEDFPFEFSDFPEYCPDEI